MSERDDPEAVGVYVRDLVRHALLLPPGAKIMVLIDDPQDPTPGPTGLFTEITHTRGIALLLEAGKAMATANAELASVLTKARRGVRHG